ncbi:hypothetical protein INR49_006017, partial [Caranx melampygus]
KKKKEGRKKKKEERRRRRRRRKKKKVCCWSMEQQRGTNGAIMSCRVDTPAKKKGLVCTRKQEQDLSNLPTCQSPLVEADCVLSDKQRRAEFICSCVIHYRLRMANLHPRRGKANLLLHQLLDRKLIIRQITLTTVQERVIKQCQLKKKVTVSPRVKQRLMNQQVKMLQHKQAMQEKRETNKIREIQ